MQTNDRENENLFEEMTHEKIEQIVKNFLVSSPDDFDELEEFIEDHEDKYPDGLADYVFRLAIQMGNKEYVELHAEDFDLNDEDGYSTYLYETDDEEMQELLMDCGAFRSFDDYDDCRFAMETVNGEILAFDQDFQREVFEKYKKEFGFTDEEICKIIADGSYDDVSDRDLETDFTALGIKLENGGISFEHKGGDDGYDLRDLLEELGWECDFEGDSWKFETLGVYFIN